MVENADKRQVRQILRKRRMALPKAYRRQAERRVSGYLKTFLKRGRKMAVYWPVGSELRLDGLVAAARSRGVRLYLPYIEKGQRRLWFTPYPNKPHTERRTRRNLAIPQFAGRKIRAHELQAVLVPLVGIDADGYRMGQGGGFYDTSLSCARYGRAPLKIGVGFACQVWENLPLEAHDVRLDVWVCEQGIRRFRQCAGQSRNG